MKSSRVAGLIAVSVIGLIPLTLQAGTIAAWNFETPSNAVGNTNTPAPSTGTGTLTTIGMGATDDVVLGKGSDTGANTVANLTQTFRVRATPPNGNGWSSTAGIATQGMVISTSTAGFSGPINVTFDWYATTQGEANLQFQYSTDGGSSWINAPLSLNGSAGSDAGLVVLTNSASANTVAGSYVSDNMANNGTSSGQGWFNGLSASITDVAAADNPDFQIQIVNASTGVDNVSTQGTALNNSSGNWRFDNIAITATPTPEPATLGLLAIGGLAFVVRRRR